MGIRIEQLNQKNFEDYEKLTCKQAHGGCYCSFWHQKWHSMTDWEKCQKETPEKNRQLIFEKMRSGFHVGVLAYQGNDLLAWLSVGPLIEYYWTWKRVVQVGEDAKSIAGITCFTIASDFRGQGLQAKILEAYLPEGLSEEEIGKLVDAEISANPGAKAGQIIGAVVKKTGGSADGTLVSKLVNAKLSK